MNDTKLDFKTRLYNLYLTTQSNFDINQVRQDLKHRAPYLKSIIRYWIPSNRDIAVLDLACGYGALLYFLSEEGYKNLNGVDISKEQITIAKQLGLKFVSAEDILNVLKKTKNESLDVVIAFDVLEHLSKQEILLVVDEVHRVLKSKGTFIVHVPNGEAIFSGAVFWGDLSHETSFTRRSITQLMMLAGFKTVSFHEDIPVVHGIKSALRSFIWQLVRYIFRFIYMAETGDIGKELILTQNLLSVARKE